MERAAAETFYLCNYRVPTHNKQPISPSPSFLRSRSSNCLGGSCFNHDVFFMTAVSSLRDVKHVALRAKQQPHHLPQSPWGPSISTYGRSIIIAGTTQAGQHVQQKSTSRKRSQRCEFALPFCSRCNIQTLERPSRSPRRTSVRPTASSKETSFGRWTDKFTEFPQKADITVRRSSNL